MVELVISKINSAVVELFAGISGSGSLFKASAFACSMVFLHVIVYSYEARIHALR